MLFIITINFLKYLYDRIQYSRFKSVNFNNQIIKNKKISDIEHIGDTQEIKK